MNKTDDNLILGIEKIPDEKNTEVKKQGIKSRIKSTLRKIPSKKSHLDFVLALLSVPVLVTAIIINVGNLQNKNKTAIPTPIPIQTIQPTQEKQIIIVPSSAPNLTPSSTPQPVCIKKIGPINISYPSENQTLTDNPLCINIQYSDTNYCSIVWSYRINNGSWSEYSSNSPCLYNMPSGTVKFELRVQSTVSQDQTSLTRNFIYQNNNIIPTPTPTMTPPPTPTTTPATGSASMH